MIGRAASCLVALALLIPHTSLNALPPDSLPITAPYRPDANWRAIEGKGTLYSPGLMERVAARRGISKGGATGFATYPDCSAIGSILVVSVLDPRTKRWSSWDAKRIVDCSQPRDYARHVSEGLVELSYADALKYGYAREGRTRIRFYRR